MKRRNLLQFLAGALFFKAPAVARLLRVEGPFSRSVEWLGDGHPLKIKHPILMGRYLDYGIFWTGWKHIDRSIDDVMQWVGYPLDYNKAGNFTDQRRPMLYASWPGSSGVVRRGQDFTIEWTEEQGKNVAFNPIDWMNDERCKSFAKEYTLGRLLSLIDEHSLVSQRPSKNGGQGLRSARGDTSYPVPAPTEKHREAIPPFERSVMGMDQSDRKIAEGAVLGSGVLAAEITKLRESGEI